MKLPTIKLYDNFLKKEITLIPNIYISHDGRLVILYESDQENYFDFGDTEETYEWSPGDENHVTILGLENPE